MPWFHHPTGENMCGLIVFCIAIGIIMTRIRSDKNNEQSENMGKVIEFFNCLMLGTVKSENRLIIAQVVDVQ